MKLYILGAGLILAGTFFGAQAIAPRKVETKTVTKTVTKAVPEVRTVKPVYHIGDSQEGVTLIGEYHTSYQDSMGASPWTVEVVVFALEGAQDLPKHSVLLLSDGSYATPDTPLTTFPDLPACVNACVAFTNPGLVIKNFLYNGLEWSL